MRADTHTSDSSDLLWESETLQVHTCGVSSMDNNIYLVTCLATGAQAVIDAADEPDRIATLIERGTGRLEAVITTHRHWDHHRALAEIVRRTRSTTYAGAPDAAHLPVATDVSLAHGDVVRVGEIALQVIGLRGHTPGSIALSLSGGDAEGTILLFTGDSLFPGGPGKTNPGQDFESLMDDLTDRVFDVYPDPTLVLPGHGDGTSIGAERPHLQQWRRRGW